MRQSRKAIEQEVNKVSHFICIIKRSQRLFQLYKRRPADQRSVGSVRNMNLLAFYVFDKQIRLNLHGDSASMNVETK